MKYKSIPTIETRFGLVIWLSTVARLDNRIQESLSWNVIPFKSISLEEKMLEITICRKVK